eukprot:5781328-Karenia_brevis.AAC.1
MTRTRLAEEMLFVGAPPKDVYYLLEKASAMDEEQWKAALRSMITVNEGLKVRGNDVLPFKGREREWPSQDILQG